MAPPVSFQSPIEARRNTANRVIRPSPTGRAAARHTLEMSSAGVVTKISSDGELVGRMEHQDQEGERCGNRQDVEKRPRLRFQHSDDCRHSHVLGTLKRQHGAQHGEPEKENAGEFVRPDQRLLEQIAGGNAREEHDDFRDHERSRGDSDERRQEPLDLSQGAGRARVGERCAGVHFLRDLHGRHPMLPAYFCSSAQASSPNLALASL